MMIQNKIKYQITKNLECYQIQLLPNLAFSVIGWRELQYSITFTAYMHI